MTKLTKNEKVLRKASKKWENFLAEGAFKQVNENNPPKASDGFYIHPKRTPLRVVSGSLKGAEGKAVEFTTSTTGETAVVIQLTKDADKKVFGKAGDEVIALPVDIETIGTDVADDPKMDRFNDMPSRDGELREARMGEYGKMDAEQGLPPTKIGRGNEEYMAAYNAVLQARGEEPLDIQKPDQAYLDALRSGQLEEGQAEMNLQSKAKGKAMQVAKIADEIVDLMVELEGFLLMKENEKKNLKEEVAKRVTKLLSEGLTPEQIEEGIGDFLRKGIDTVKKKTGLGKSMATRDSMENLRSLGFEFKEMLEEYLPTPEEINVMSDVFADYGRSAGGGSSRDPLRQAFSKLPKLKQKVLMNPSVLRKQVKTFEKKAYEIYDNIQRSGDKTAKKASLAGRALIEEIEGMIPFAKNLRQAFEEARKTGNAEGAKELADQKAREHRALMKQIDANTRSTAAAGRERDRQAKRDARRRDDKEQDIVRGKSTQRFGMATNLEEAAIEDFAIELEGNLSFEDIEEAGLITPGVDSVIDNGDGYAQVYAEPQAMMEMAKTLEAMTGIAVSPQSHGAVDEEMSKKDFVRMVRDKGKVPNLKGDMGPLPGLEGPFQYRSGAVLYYDPKAGKYYDRGKDMYLDDQEAAELTMESNPSSFATRVTHSSDPEMDQVMDIAADMLELSARSRIPVSLVGVESALQKQGFDTEMEKEMLIVDNKYVIAKIEALPKTAQKISFTKYAADYLSNLSGEQQDLPLG